MNDDDQGMESDQTSDLRQSWARHPYTHQIVAMYEKQIAEATQHLVNAAANSTDPKITALAGRLLSMREIFLTLAIAKGGNH